MSRSKENEIQIIYTRVDRDRFQRPHFTTFRYVPDSLRYFYPASTVKLAAAVLAMQKLHDLHVPGLDIHTPLRIDSAFAGQRRLERDSTSLDGLPSIGLEIKKVFLVSDNAAFNVLYEFLGRAALNSRLGRLGLHDTRILQRLAVGDNPLSSGRTNPFLFSGPGGELFRQAPQVDSQVYSMPAHDLLKGKGYMVYHGSDSLLVDKPFDFSGRNFFPLGEQQKLLRMMMFPETWGKSASALKLDAGELGFLHQCMSMFPRESRHPSYPEAEFPDNYAKFLVYGSPKPVHIPKGVRIFNKIGLAYGYMIDNAFVVDFNTGTEFFISAVINCNTSGIYNNNRYAYDQMGFPFMRELGKLFLEYEQKRQKKIKPDLARFRLSY